MTGHNENNWALKEHGDTLQINTSAHFTLRYKSLDINSGNEDTAKQIVTYEKQL